MTPRRKRVLRWGAAVLLALLLLLPLGSWLYLTSDAGAALLVSRGLEAVNADLQGSLRVKAAHTSGGLVVLEELQLFTPEGELVAEVARVEARPRLLALAGGRLDLPSVKIERPRFYLKTDERGLNLSRAIASRAPAVPSAPTRAEVELGEVALTQGYVDYRFGDERYTVENIRLDGKLAVLLPRLRLRGALNLKGQVTAPLVDPLELSVEAKRGDASVEVFARTSDTHARGTLWLEPVKLVVTDSVASARAVRAFVPALKLKQSVTISTVASPEVVELKLAAGKARITARAAFPAGRLIDALSLHVEGLDLEELLEGGLRSQLSADLEGSLDDARVETLTGTLKGQASWVAEGKPLATAEVDVTALGGKLQVKKLEAKAPGASVVVVGSGDRDTLELSGKLELTQLGALAKAVANFTGTEPLPLSGAGSFQLAGSGPLLHPAVSAQGGFTSFGYDTLRVTELKLKAQLADLTRPLEAQARLSAARVALGETVLEGLSGQLTTRGRALKAVLSTQGLASLAMTLEAEGTIDADGRGLQLAALSVDYPKLRWELERPSHLGWTQAGDVTMEPLALKVDQQRLSLEASLKAGQLEASAQLQKLELGRLPRPLVPASLRLAGLLDAKVRVSGPTAKLQTQLELAWRDGAVKGLEGISLVVRAKSEADRVEGAFTAATALGQAAAGFSLPLGRKAGKPQPVSLHLSTSAVDLNKAAQAFGQALPFSGAVTTALDLEGTLDQPAPVLELDSSDLRLCRGGCEQGLPFDRVVLRLEADAQQRPAGTLTVNALGGQSQLIVLAGFTFGQLVDAYLPASPRRGPAAKARGLDWPAAPLEVNVRAEGVDLVQVASALALAAPLQGKLSLVAKGKGTLAHPDVEATLGVTGFQADGLKPLELSSSLLSSRDDTRVTLTARRGASSVVSLSGRLGGPLERLATDAQLLATPLLVDAQVGPAPLGEVLAPAEDEEVVAGTVRAQLSVRGTAAAPTASLRGTLESLKVAKVALGQANLTWDYAERRHVFAVALTSGGRLKANGELALELSVPALRKGLALASAPLKATLTATDFELGVFTGVHPMVRTLGGLLRLDAKVEGPLRSPGFEGRLEWVQGRLGLAGLGDFRDLHLLFTGTNAGYRLEDLSGKAGFGSFALSGAARRERPGVFSLSGKGALTKFPVITDDQLLAIASLGFTVEGEASAQLIDLQRLAIGEAHVELPDVKRKDLQELERPGDIILVRHGVPVKKKKRAPDDAAAQAAEGRRTVRVTLDAPRNLWVKSSDVNLELGLSEKFYFEYTDRPLIYGEANVLRGRLDVIGRRFDLQKNSQVRFGGPAAQPYLNVSATHVNERENVSVFVNVTGRGKDATLKLSSQPSLPDSELVILLTTGRRTLKRGGGSSISGADAASVLGSIAASQLKTLVAKKLPLDVLSIESGAAGIENARVEAGTYLSDQLYLGYLLQLGADRGKGENVNAGKLEYQFSKSWSLEVTAGDAPSAGAELVWSRDF